jgi:DNA-binding GntR family transcriptional regulator
MNKASKASRPATPARAPARERDNAVAVEERMYQDIYDAIMEHRLPPRTKLTEQTLCQIYDTARHTVRKVLARLAAEGMVDLEANRGAFIASPSPAEVRDMFELRNILEHAVLEKLGRTAGTRQIAGLRPSFSRSWAAPPVRARSRACGAWWKKSGTATSMATGRAGSGCPRSSTWPWPS